MKSRVDKETYVQYLPDTLCWRNKLHYNEPYVEYYFRHPAYRHYPVVGVSYSQAEAYCAWLTTILNQNLTRDDYAVEKVIVRLPTEAEWKLAAYGTHDTSVFFPWGYNALRNTDKKHEGQMLANFVRGKDEYMGVAGQLNDNADVTAPVYSYWPNSIGIYNMCGNVSEFVQDKKDNKRGWLEKSGIQPKNQPF